MVVMWENMKRKAKAAAKTLPGDLVHAEQGTRQQHAGELLLRESEL